jgi:hypothetical protein
MSESLQFEHAEFDQAPPVLKCSRCDRTLHQSYYQINGEIACEACALTAESSDEGSGLGRALRATGAGIAAAVLGAVLYYAIGAITGYEFGLIAILVGFAVGAAVRWGSRGRGGWKYQTLAVALTYLAIVSTYVPYIFAAANAQMEAEESAGVPGDPADDDDDDDDDDDGEQAAIADDGAAGVTAASATGASPNVDAQQLSGGDAAMAMGALILLLCAAPFLAGFENIIGLLIIGFGLFEAWKLNRREEIVMSGPHPVTAQVATTGA